MSLGDCLHYDNWGGRSSLHCMTHLIDLSPGLLNSGCGTLGCRHSFVNSFPSALDCDVIKLATSTSCYVYATIMIDSSLELWAKINPPFHLSWLLLGYFIIVSKTKLWQRLRGGIPVLKHTRQ